MMNRELKENFKKEGVSKFLAHIWIDIFFIGIGVLAFIMIYDLVTF